MYIKDSINTNYKILYVHDKNAFHYKHRRNLHITDNIIADFHSIVIKSDTESPYLEVMKIVKMGEYEKWIDKKDEIKSIKESDIKILQDLARICENDLLLSSKYIRKRIKIAKKKYGLQE